MSKKPTLILSSIILIVILAVGGLFAYQKNLLTPLFKGGSGGISSNPSDIVLTPETLLSSFQNKNPNLTAQQFQLFQQRFNETKEILQKEPDLFDSWLYLGILKKGVGDYEGARDVFLYAAKLRPGSSPPFANLADIYTYFLNEPQKAESAIKQAIANDPDDYNFYISLADIYRYKFPDRQGMYEQTMLEALAKFPDNVNLIAPLAAYFRDTDQIQKAIEWYEKLVILSPANQMAKDDLAELRQK